MRSAPFFPVVGPLIDLELTIPSFSHQVESVALPLSVNTTLDPISFALERINKKTSLSGV